MGVSKRVEKKLKDYDRNLRIRFSRERHMFVLERRAERRFLPKPVIYRGTPQGIREVRCPENSDRYVQYHDGYLEIMRFPEVPRNIMQILYMSDAKRQAKTFVKDFEEREAKREALKEAKTAEKMQNLSGEAFDSMAWRSGRRAAVPGLKEAVAA